ncbi:MAG: hypothetical protein LBE20_05655 [Deltaproteobacteria bacterium]|jgi:hypothetical protein|nr:hypothetical protein [Deltaproteobacteria bacterium]
MKRMFVSLMFVLATVVLSTTITFANDEYGEKLIKELQTIREDKYATGFTDILVDPAIVLIARAYADSVVSDNMSANPIATAQVIASLSELGNGTTERDLLNLLKIDPFKLRTVNYLKFEEKLKSKLGSENYKTFSVMLLKSPYSFRKDIPEIFKKKYGLQTYASDLSEENITELNQKIKTISGFKNVVSYSPNNILLSVSASDTIGIWPNEMTYRRGKFLGQTVPAIIGKINSYNTVHLNKRYKGYKFELKNSNAYFFLVDDKDQLKKLAFHIADKGVLVSPLDDTKKGPINLVIPEIDSQKSEINYKEFALKNGHYNPFITTADYSKGIVGGTDVYCSDLKTFADLQISEMGIRLKQVTYAALGSKGLGPKIEKLPEIKIDRPFLLLLADKEYGCCFTMAFVSELPKQDEESE